jgi:hypothetical protein
MRHPPPDENAVAQAHPQLRRPTLNEAQTPSRARAVRGRTISRLEPGCLPRCGRARSSAVTGPLRRVSGTPSPTVRRAACLFGARFFPLVVPSMRKLLGLPDDRT